MENPNDLISKVVTYIEDRGFSVDLFSDELDEDVSGRCYYDRKEIHIDCATAMEALYTIIHEAGHMLSYLRLFVQQKRPQPTEEQRELYALQYGWVVIRELGLPITKEMWRANYI